MTIADFLTLVALTAAGQAVDLENFPVTFPQGCDQVAPLVATSGVRGRELDFSCEFDLLALQALGEQLKALTPADDEEVDPSGIADE